MLRLPIIIIVSIVFLFYFLGVSFLAGIGILLLAFVFNLFISRFSAKMQTKYMEHQDKRVNLTTECLNNIKMLKLYSWQQAFEKMIGEKRKEELSTLWRRMRFGMTNTTSLYFFPSILGTTVFSVYIGTGNKLDLSIAYTITTILAMLRVSRFFICNAYLATVVVAAYLYWHGGRVPGVHESHLEIPTLPRDQQVHRQAC